MRLEEARRLAACISTVGGNGFYQMELLNEVRRAFPEFRWAYAPGASEVCVAEHATPLCRQDDPQRLAA